MSAQMTKTFRDNSDINDVQQTSCELLFPDVHTGSKLYFFVPFVRSCMHHNYVVISGSHACTILGAGLYTTFRGESVLVAIRFNVTFLPLRRYCEKMCTSFLNDAESLKTCGCALGLYSSLFFEHYNRILLCEWSDFTVFVWERVYATIFSYFTWPWPGLDLVPYSGRGVMPSVMGQRMVALKKCV